MPTIISEDCSAIALYGMEPKVAGATGFYAAVVKWFAYLGAPPDKASIHGPGHSGKPVEFASANAKVEKAGFDGVTAFSVYSMAPDGKIPVNDYLLAASYQVSDSMSYAFVVARAPFATLSIVSMLPIAQSLIHSLQPKYGIGYRRVHRLGPGMYAIGIGQGLGPGGYGIDLSEGEKAEAESISRWGNGMTARVWQKGLLRDVFSWNFLTQAHLATQIGSVPLRSWIQQDLQRGTLSSLSDGISLWEVAAENIPYVRQALRQADAIFDWRKHL